MTSNQINYQKLLEDRRHNKVVEDETKKQNLRDALIRKEQVRANKDIANMQLAHSYNVLEETKRHNIQQEERDLMYATRQLDETSRHNLAQESIAQRNAYLTEKQLNNNFTLGLANIENLRNQTAEAQRHNVAVENEAFRHNVANESNDSTRIQNAFVIDRQKSAETQRSNVQRELLQYESMSEQKRHNFVTEDTANRAQATNTLTHASEQLNLWYKTLKHKRR